MCVTAFGSIKIVSERLCSRAGRLRRMLGAERAPTVETRFVTAQDFALASSLLSGSIGTLSPAKASNQASSTAFHLSHFARH